MIKKLYKAIERKEISVNDISEKYNVSNRTVQRWIAGDSKPKLEVQYDLFSRIENDSLQTIVDELKDNETRLSIQIDNMLQGLREAFYRWGEYSSRNQALVELSKLILAQIGLIKQGKQGIHDLEFSSSNSNEFIEVINNALSEILGKYSDSLFLQSDYKISLRKNQSNLIKEVCHEFNKVEWSKIQTITKLDLFNEIFGRFLSNSFVDEKEMGQYLTPIEMTRFIVKMAINGLSSSEFEILTHPTKCKNFGYILDPSCGAGSFLVEVIHQLLPKVQNEYGNSKVNTWLNNMGNHVLAGIDKSQRMFQLTVFNFRSLGIPCENIYSTNSLIKNENEGKIEAAFLNKTKLILTNPPFGAEFNGESIIDFKLFKNWASKRPKKIDSELLFIEKYIDWLKDGGYCLTVIPDSILTNKGIFQDLRKGIHPHIELQSVVSFPSETFAAAGTSTKTSVMSFIKESNSIDSTYFGICENVGFKVITKGSTKVKVTQEVSDLNGLLIDIFETKKNLKYGRRIKFDDSFYRWDANFHASLSDTENSLLERNSEFNIFVRDIATLVNNRLDPRRLYSEFNYIEISDVLASGIVKSKKINAIDAPSRARKQVQKGDVLASTVRPEQRKIGYVINDSDNNSICTTGLAVLRPKGIQPMVLVELLKSDFVTKQLKRNNIGIAYPAIEENCYLDVLLPLKKSDLPKLNNRAKELEKLKITLLNQEKKYKQEVLTLTHNWEIS